MMTILIWISFQAGQTFSGSALFTSMETCNTNRLMVIETMLEKGIKAKNIYVNCTYQ